MPKEASRSTIWVGKAMTAGFCRGNSFSCSESYRLLFSLLFMLNGPAWSQKLRSEIGIAVIGQDAVVERLLVALLANGHVLLEGMPGLAKTLLIKSLGTALGVQFERVQFTPDLLPSDVVGTMIFQPKSGEFTSKLGPIFANLVLADEINRAPAKVQSALLEGMHEREVTIGVKTYVLPEAQLDRFMLMVKVGYPNRDEERQVMDRMTGALTIKAQSRTKPEQLLQARKVVRDVCTDERVKA